jgi:hypothetical protein
MAGEIGVGPVDHRLVAAGLGNAGLQIVADRLPGSAAEIAEGAEMRGDPIGQLLAPGRLGVGERFDALPRAKGWLARGGQIIDATVIEARRPRLSHAEKDTLRSGGTPAEWKPTRRAQIDRDGRWTIKRGREARGRAG